MPEMTGAQWPWSTGRGSKNMFKYYKGKGNGNGNKGGTLREFFLHG